MNKYFSSGYSIFGEEKMMITRIASRQDLSIFFFRDHGMDQKMPCRPCHN